MGREMNYTFPLTLNTTLNTRIQTLSFVRYSSATMLTFLMMAVSQDSRPREWWKINLSCLCRLQTRI